MGMSIKSYTLKIEGLGDSLTSIDVHSMRKTWQKYASMACHKDLAHLELSSSKETSFTSMSTKFTMPFALKYLFFYERERDSRKKPKWM